VHSKFQNRWGSPDRCVAGENNEEGSQIVLPGGSNQQLHTSGVSTSTPGHSEDVTRGCALLPDETDANAPGRFPTERESEDQHKRERNDQGTATERQTKVPRECQ
jgi:hypothetical protein